MVRSPPEGVSATMSPSIADPPRRIRPPLKSVDDMMALLADRPKLALDVETVGLDEATGRVAPIDIGSPSELPPFDRSAVDGYGLQDQDLQRSSADELALTAKLPAGHAPSGLAIEVGQTIWLATGAAIPAGVAAVVMEEHVDISSPGLIRLAGRRVEPGANIRRRGEDVGLGDVVVKAGTVLDARHIAILAAVGCYELGVLRKLRVLVFSAGDELLAPANARTPHATFDSNRPMLRALLSLAMVDLHDGGVFGDDPAPLSAALKAAAGNFDLIVTSGAAAGSATDRVGDAVAQAGGQVSRHHVAIKPGKPLMFGAIGSTAFLGLPGNPVAAYVSARLFAIPLIQAMSSATPSGPNAEPAVAEDDMRHQPGRTEFAPARVVGLTPDGRKRVVKLGSGGSASLSPLIEADGLVELDAQCADIARGEPVVFHSFNAGREFPLR
jgi:molybdopterin molybdotransferase